VARAEQAGPTPASQVRSVDVDTSAIRWFDPVSVPVARATDLGSVQVIKHGDLYLLTDPFGDVHVDSRGLGLYDRDTRLLSCSQLRVNGTRPVLLQGTSGGNYRGTIQLTNPSIDRNIESKVNPLDDLAGRKIGIGRDRVMSLRGLEERISVENYAEHPETVTIELELGIDGADIFEVRGRVRDERGTLQRAAALPDHVTFRYDGRDGRRRSTHLRFSESAEAIEPIEPHDDGSDTGAWLRYRWTWPLGPGQRRELRLVVWATIGEAAKAGDSPAELFPEPPRIDQDQPSGAYHAWTRSTAEVDTDHELFDLTVNRSVADLRLLVNETPGEAERYMAAGVPWFSTLFGRDSLISSLQAVAFRPQIGIETLGVLAARQATQLDEWRDAEPGKILHELRVGEMAATGELPHSPYYGSVDATPLWLVLLGEVYDWTGDLDLVDRLWPNALAALDWIDRYGDRDGDGFVEYQRRTEHGLLNQGWKDSSDAIRDRHGREVSPPIALAEVQGYVFDAKRRMAALARARGEADLAEHLEHDAEQLRAAFEAAFWVEDQGFYAMALDRDKKQADAIASNAGHCLWSGIVSPARARNVATRLMSPQMFSGWGVRTYANDQPGYNPLGYHTGSVWPHDTSLVAAGLKRYGFNEESNRLVGDILEAAQHFPAFRLPELFCGFAREDNPDPVPYPVACSPQAWAAAAPFLFLKTMLGLRAHADRNELELWHPHLPSWVGRVTVRNLQVGGGAVDLLFHSWRGTTSAEVLRKVGDVNVTIRL
jgi:glycogen debranching enzyme